MTKNEIARLIGREDMVLNVAEMDEMMAAFETDAQKRFELVELFSDARMLIVRNDNSSDTAVRLHVCAQRYLTNLMKAPAKFQDVISMIYADEVGYFSVRNDQALALHYANMVLDRESVPDVVYSRVLGLAIDSLLKLEMYSVAGKYVERLEVFVESHSLPERQLYMMYANLAYGYGFLKNRAKFELFSRRIAEFDKKDLPDWLVYFCDLYLLGSLAVLDRDLGNGNGNDNDNDNASADGKFAARYNRLIRDNKQNRYETYSVYLIDEAFLLIPIFERAWGLVGPDSIMESIEQLTRHSSSVSEKADFYSWFFDKMGADKSRFSGQYEDYIAVLREYRKQNDENHRQQVADEILHHDFEDKYRRQATIDSLTGLLNRFVYESEVDELRGMEELPQNLRIVMADLNNLKMTNDTFGHQVGDELIRGAASCLGNAYGRLGRVFRIGGDEFIALVYCDDASLEKANALLEHNVSEWRGETLDQLFLSVGSASAAELPGRSVLQLLRLAEERMYAEKNRFYTLPGNDRRKH